ncbi:hypothetical protein FWH13_03405 [Candidatus Saccharibacteria bacterium]|nr:hypothetical protein [Candidatus Saccharibacteria bacterium]
MVCIAAFIILCILSVFFGALSLFRPDIGSRYWKTFKKAWGCVFTKLKLQKCETNFKDDIKNSMLSKVVIKHPKAVKPLSALIEIAAVAIVFITIWSLVVALRGGLSLIAFGTCDINDAESCSQARVCTAAPEDATFLRRVGRWFTGWGDIFVAIPDRFRTYDAEQLIEDDMLLTSWHETPSYAIYVFDPGCDMCLISFRNKISQDFFSQNSVAIIPYPMFSNDQYTFRNSGVISRYFLAAEERSLAYSEHPALSFRLLERLFTGYNDQGFNYQSVFNITLDETDAAALLEDWLRDFGLSENDIIHLRERANSSDMDRRVDQRKAFVDQQLNGRGVVPITIYNNRKHIGLFR